MTTKPPDARTALQAELDETLDDEALLLDVPRERPGPVTIQNRITVDGRGCTLWAVAGPVLTVLAEGVVLKNLRVECTAEGAEEGPRPGVALLVEGEGLVMENVTVRGAVQGLTTEAGEWRYPHQLTLGSLAPQTEHMLRVRLVVPVPCQLTSEISGLTVEPRALAPGSHEVRLRLEPMLRDTLLSGTIGLKTAFLRREIVVNAHVLAPTEGLPEPASERDRVVWQPVDWGEMPAAAPPPPRAAPPRPPAPPPAPVAARPAPVVTPPPARPAPVVAPPPAQPAPVPAPAAPPTVAAGPAPAPRPSLRRIQGPLLGGLFTSPPVGSSPPAGGDDPPSPGAEPEKEAPPTEPTPAPPARKKVRPAGGLPSWVKAPPPPDPPPSDAPPTS